jgi:hypothetical protein
MDDEVNSYTSKSFDEYLTRAAAANVNRVATSMMFRRGRLARHKLAIPLGRLNTICSETSRLNGRTAGNKVYRATGNK